MIDNDNIYDTIQRKWDAGISPTDEEYSRLQCQMRQDVLDGLTSLTKPGVEFTDEQKAMIDSMGEQRLHVPYVMVRFERNVDDTLPVVMGPFLFAQLTHEDLRVGPDGDIIAQIYHGCWHITNGDFLQETPWTDVVIYHQ